MAQSPAHRFGQIIGDMLEFAIRPILQAVATELKMYLDGKGERKARGIKRKVAWVDAKGNTHDLDYVFEAGGNADNVGSPRAFIEIAWRRYTKHSRNKAQEIQGAILPLAERYHQCHPFLGVVLGGVFTDGSLNQLRSSGFAVLYFPYESVIAAFKSVGIDTAFDEDTPDSTLLKKVKLFEKPPVKSKENIAAFLRNRHDADIKNFIVALRVALTRRIKSVYVLPLHGSAQTLDDIDEAITFIQNFDETKPGKLFARYEVGVRYTNGDEIHGEFGDKITAIAFLRDMR